jgi:ferredoxin
MSTVTFTLDGARVSAPRGQTLLEIARREGVEIPTLCHLAAFTPSGSCLVCLVREGESGRLVPSCATVAQDGVSIETSTAEVQAARRRSVELLLSEHAGECEAPCVRACPGGVDIPRMIRQIAGGRPADALATIRRRVALPASLSWKCSSLCERACRRSRRDGPLSICLLKRHAAGRALADPSLPAPRHPAGEGGRVAVVGAGPAGLSAAWFLLVEGHACTVFEKSAAPGGALRHGEGERPPRDVLEAEIHSLRRLGAVIEVESGLGGELDLDTLADEFDAVVLATGTVERGELASLGDDWNVDVSPSGIAVEPRTFRTSRKGVYAAGSVIRPRRHPSVAAAQGRAAALALHRLLSRREVDGGGRRFSSILGSLRDGEIDEFMKGADPSPPVTPASGSTYTPEEARREASRCMHCDCRKKEDCRLRETAAGEGAVQRRFAGGERSPVVRVRDHEAIVFEPGKCIRCGLCLQAAATGGGRGLAFLGKGIEMRVGAPLGLSLAEALGPSAAECANVCPTGAIALRK